jgi:nucleoside-diphosphate-sugar epimerase
MTDDRKITRALVTGATGFLGSNLVRELTRRNITVRGLVRNMEKAESMGLKDVEWVEGDIVDGRGLDKAVAGADTVFHAAAVLGPAALKPADYRAVNVQGVKNMIAACRTAGCVDRFVHVSSVGVLGPLEPRQKACEGTPPKPDDIYEITKLEGEMAALEAAEEGFPAVIARPAWVYGPGDRRTLKLFRRIAHKQFFVVGKAQNKQHPVWIEDVIDGMIRCAVVPGIEGRVYHLAGPQTMKVQILCETVAEAANVKLCRIRPPFWLVMLAAYPIEWLFALWRGNPPLDHRKVDFFIVNRAYSIQRARDELGWVPKMKFSDGIAKTIAWYRDNGDIRKSESTDPENT